MKIEIIEFLLPQLDWIQAIFFLLIFGATISTMLAVRRQATSQNWEAARVKVVVAHVMQPTAVYRDSH